jgi:hypothetical protein
MNSAPIDDCALPPWPESHSAGGLRRTLARVMPARLPAVLAALAFVLAGCAGESDEAVVLSAEDVIDGDITVSPDSSGISATVRVTTSIDMVCAVVYGTTPELGDGIATDSDMGGGAHTDHEAVLTGLEPNTEYYLRVQGSGSDGQLYRSELITFRTSEAEPPERPGENIAVGADVVEVSSEFSDTFAAANAIDGDPATEWSTAGDGDDAWITIDLGQPVDVVGIGFHSREMGDGTSIVNSFSVTVDDDETFGPYPGGPGLSLIDVAFTGQVLRFDAVDTTGGNTGVVEIEVYR